MRMRSAVIVAVTCSVLWLSTGCGGVYYTVSINAAQTRLEQAREMGAETKAPFEYYYAREHLRQAQVEAAEASYSDAASMAETAETYAQKAIDRIQTARKADSAQPHESAK
jgi:hypothetical protein